MLSAVATAAEQPAFDPAEIRAATAKLIRALEDPDPTAWVHLYAKDAGLLEAGSAPLQWRVAGGEWHRKCSYLLADRALVMPAGLESGQIGRISCLTGHPPALILRVGKSPLT